MELLQQAVEQRLFRCAPHLAELQWLYLLKLGLQRLPIHGDHRGLAPVGQRIARNLPHRRQLDQSLAVQLQHQPATYHVAQGDRKSTRLNSSHVAISYAVFCLKKKNTTQKPETPKP